MRVAVVRSARTSPTALSLAVAPVLRAAGHRVAELPVTSGEPLSLDDHDVVIVLSPEQPSLHAHHSEWREWDRWHATTVPWLTSVARSARVRRIVLQSSALLYADGAAATIDEKAAVAVTAATEPWCAAETATHRFADGEPRSSVVLRIAPLTDDPAVAPWLHAAAARPGHCPQVRWQPVVQVSDAVDAFVRALDAPAGIYNVGDSTLGPDSTEASRHIAGRVLTLPHVGHLLPWRARIDDRLEPYCRSIRIDADRFGRAVGWHPHRLSSGSRG